MNAYYQVDLQVARNEDWTDQFELFDEAAGVALSLAGATFAMDIRDAAGVLKLQLTTGNGRLVIHDAAAGLFGILVLQATVTSSLPAGHYQYDLLMEQAGRRRRLMAGAVAVKPGVTQWP